VPEDTSPPPPREWLGAPRMSMPLDSNQIFGCTRQRWALHIGIGVVSGLGSEASVLVIHTGVRLKMSVLGFRCRRWAQNKGVGPCALVLGRTHWHWVLGVGAGCTCWRSAQHIGDGVVKGG